VAAELTSTKPQLLDAIPEGIATRIALIKLPTIPTSTLLLGCKPYKNIAPVESLKTAAL
jgi:hypothetical protein